MTVLEIDGNMGEGGGQVLRSAVTLAMCLNKPIVVKNIRAGRKKTGLLRQHLAAVNAAAAISNGQLEGAQLGSTCIRFTPGELTAGTFEFRIGSAGSTTLLMQTILPALSLMKEPSTVVVHGGTHNGMAPSVDFFELALVPLLARMGLSVTSSLHEHGFYPNGGGRWQLEIEPWTQSTPLHQIERGQLVSRSAVAKISGLQEHIAARELARVRKKLKWAEHELTLQKVSSQGPGNILSLRCAYDNVTEVFESVGTMGVSAERVAGRAVRDAKRFLNGCHGVGEYLADQLLVPMILGSGGVFTTGELSSHCVTNMALINNMVGSEMFDVVKEVAEQGPFTTVRIFDGLRLAPELV